MTKLVNQKKVAIYAGVTKEQFEEGNSIDKEIESIKEICKDQNKVVVGVYADKVVSGEPMDNRPELQKLLDGSREGLFDEVMVWKASKIARDISDLLEIVTQFENSNVSFSSVSELYDTSTPTGKLMMSILAAMDKFESIANNNTEGETYDVSV